MNDKTKPYLLIAGNTIITAGLIFLIFNIFSLIILFLVGVFSAFGSSLMFINKK